MSVMFDGFELTRERYSCGLKFSDCAGIIAPLDAVVNGVKMFGSVGNDLVHEGKGLNGGSFNHIDDNAAANPLQFLNIGESFNNSAGN